MNRPVIVGSDSILVRTAMELARRHPPHKGLEAEMWCVRCWAPWPCRPARHAEEVCLAAGLKPPAFDSPTTAEGSQDAPRRAPARRGNDAPSRSKPRPAATQEPRHLALTG